MGKVKTNKLAGAKNIKKSWRKTDIQDVENFLEEKRLEERLGTPFEDRQDEELFAFDTSADDKNFSQYKSSKQISRNKILSATPRFLEILKSDSKVSDPVSKRDKHRSPEERKHPAAIEKEKRKLKAKVLDARRSRVANAQQRKKRPPTGATKDVWNEEVVVPPLLKSSWVGPVLRSYTLINTQKKEVVQESKTFNPSKPYTTAAVEVAAPGMSYNPAYEDHVKLLAAVAEKENKLIKDEQHLHRVTVDMFRKIPPEEARAQYLKEMSQGVPALDPEAALPDEPSSDNECHAVNPPVDRMKKKDRVKRRNMKAEKMKQAMIKETKLKKKQEAAVYKLKRMKTDIEVSEENAKKRGEKRKANALLKTTKRLGKNKFVDRNLDFNMPSDLKGSLRMIKPEGDLLADRYKSLQKRNIMEVTKYQTKIRKKATKRTVKKSHKIDSLTNATNNHWTTRPTPKGKVWRRKK